MVHLAGLDMQPKVQRRQRAGPWINDEIDDLLGIAGSYPAFAELNNRGPMAQRKIVHFEWAAARR
ncbi:hypothetical protein [Sphingobium sp. SCG-1]|uniref:hypothetical protein n=1 Tax=Sphingobium sp. SCG-1 TaxID=2072936 RepID=UPI001CB93FC1|nr:hypothetical protein [Sphingobium sp. SCG-1]